MHQQNLAFRFALVFGGGLIFGKSGNRFLRWQLVQGQVIAMRGGYPMESDVGRILRHLPNDTCKRLQIAARQRPMRLKRGEIELKQSS